MTEVADKPYTELYKTYRPMVWKQLIGQESVANSLKKAVVEEKLPTAFLFAGPRGCGKTSAAFILAKSVNCENPPGTGDPCNKCDTCRNIDDGSQIGVTYVSMANQGTTDDVRQLIQRAQLSQPVKQQIFILDEVHTIHKQAFDSLLIPLEDKAMKSMFILCTTEINRVPATIKSRAQSRSFSLVPAAKMTAYVKRLAQHANLEATDDDIANAVRLGKGSVRDTLTSLETVLNTGGAELPLSGQLLQSLSTHDLPATLQVLAEANTSSVDFRDFAEQLFEDLRDLLLIDSGVSNDLVGVLPVDDTDSIVKGLRGSKGILFLLNEVGDALTQISQGVDPRIRFEVALLKSIKALSRTTKSA